MCGIILIVSPNVIAFTIKHILDAHVAITLPIVSATLPLYPRYPSPLIISEYNTLEMYEAKERTFKIGNKIMVILSTILFLLMFIFAKQAAYIFIGDIDSTGNSIEDVVLVIRSISFCLLIVPYLAIKRGYLQGQKFITVSTTGEVIEQVVRVAFILVGSYLAINVFNAKTSIGVAIAVFGAFIAGLAAYIYLDVKIRKNKKEYNMPSKNKKDKVSNKTI